MKSPSSHSDVSPPPFLVLTFLLLHAHLILVRLGLLLSHTPSNTSSAYYSCSSRRSIPVTRGINTANPGASIQAQGFPSQASSQKAVAAPLIVRRSQHQFAFHSHYLPAARGARASQQLRPAAQPNPRLRARHWQGIGVLSKKARPLAAGLCQSFHQAGTERAGELKPSLQQGWDEKREK